MLWIWPPSPCFIDYPIALLQHHTFSLWWLIPIRRWNAPCVRSGIWPPPLKVSCLPSPTTKFPLLSPPHPSALKLFLSVIPMSTLRLLWWTVFNPHFTWPNLSFLQCSPFPSCNSFYSPESPSFPLMCRHPTFLLCLSLTPQCSHSLHPLSLYPPPIISVPIYLTSPRHAFKHHIHVTHFLFNIPTYCLTHT